MEKQNWDPDPCLFVSIMTHQFGPAREESRSASVQNELKNMLMLHKQTKNTMKNANFAIYKFQNIIKSDCHVN